MAEQGYTLTRGSIQRIGRATRTVENSNLPDLVRNRESILLRHDPVQWTAFRNDSGETMPAFGVGRVMGFIPSEQQLYLKVTQPDGTLGQLYVVNGSTDVISGDYGSCRLQDIGRVLVDGTPAIDETWGPKSGQWELAKYYPGFAMFGNLDAHGTAQGVWTGIDIVMGKTDAAHTAGSSGSISVYVNSVDTGINITASNVYADLEINKYCTAARIGGAWYLIAGQC